MINVGILRNNPDEIAASLARRGVDINLADLIELDCERRRVRSTAEQARAEQRDAGKEIARLQGATKQEAITRVGLLAERYREALSEADELDKRFDKVWMSLPNLVDPTAAKGFTEEDAEELRRWGDPLEGEYLDHLELGSRHGIIDIERSAKVSGSRFSYLLGPLVRLEFALIQWVLDQLEPHGFVPVVPPAMVRASALYGTGFFPVDRDQVYAVEDDDLYLVGTSEVSLAAMHAGEIFDTASLPMRYVGFSTCFRREAGAAGKDTKGIFRVHQFDKVEMFIFCHPEHSQEQHEFLLAREEELVQGLGIPYRVVNVAAGDLGSSAAKKFDIEAWFPGQQRYREITSTSNTTDYQSRRLKVRFKGGSGNELVHTLNGTAVAIGRTLIAIVENYQQPDGTIVVPEALRQYVGFAVIG